MKEMLKEELEKMILLKKSIYEKYKMDEKFNDSQQLLDITLIENEMAKND